MQNAGLGAQEIRQVPQGFAERPNGQTRKAGSQGQVGLRRIKVIDAADLRDPSLEHSQLPRNADFDHFSCFTISLRLRRHHEDTPVRSRSKYPFEHQLMHPRLDSALSR